VRKHRGGKKDDIRARKSTKIVKRSGKRGPGDPSDNLNKERGREPERTDPGNDTTGEGPESGESKNLVFVGGKKYMGKKEGSETKEADEYQCYNCDHVQGTKFTECPKCGSTNTFEE